MTKDKRTKVLFAGVVLTLIAAVGAFWFGSGDAGSQKPVSAAPTQALPYSSPQAAVAQVKVPFPATREKAPVDPKPENPGSLSDERVVNPDAKWENPYFNREVKARLAQVAGLYAEQIKYPAFSRPIPNREALQKYLPNRSFGAELPLNPADESGPRIRLQTDKHQYFTGDTIEVTVGLSGLSGDSWVAVQARLVAGGQTLATVEAGTGGRPLETYRMSFTDLDALPDSGMGEYRVVARVDMDGETYEIGTPVSYVASVAEVTNVGLARVSGEYLYIPVDVTTSKPGYHELDANLYAEKSGKPLLHLSVQQELQSARGLMQLQVHISALKAGGDAGPYLLKDILFTRMPAAPDFTTEYGNTSQDAYVVNGYTFDEYDDVPYVDEEDRKRLEFLRQLGEAD